MAGGHKGLRKLQVTGQGPQPEFDRLARNGFPTDKTLARGNRSNARRPRLTRRLFCFFWRTDNGV